MNPTPTPEAVALAAARYAVAEFTSMHSWLSYEDELAAEWMENSTFRCTVAYATDRVIALLPRNRQMQSIAGAYPKWVDGVAAVIGRVVGEWVGGRTTVDQELATW